MSWFFLVNLTYSKTTGLLNKLTYLFIYFSESKTYNAHIEVP